MKIKICILILLLGSILQAQQITREDIREFLITQNSGLDPYELDAQSEILYGQLLERISFRFRDAAEGTLYSALSGIGMGANEANVSKGSYEQYKWLPKPLQQWYVSSRKYKFGEPNYDPLSWQFVFREIDFAADRAAYDQWLRFYKNKWYYALLTHWVIKNTAATITRDAFRYNRPFFSFDISMLLPTGKTYNTQR